MKVAILTNWARTRSIGKIAWGLRDELVEQGYETKLFYGRKDELAENEKDVIRFCTDREIYSNAALARIFGNEGFNAKASTKRLIEYLEDFNPDVFYIIILHGYYVNFPMLFDYLGKKKTKVIYLMLDEYAFLGKCPYSFECNQFKTECISCNHLSDYPRSLLFDRANDIFKAKEIAYSKIKDLSFVGIQYTVDRAKQSALLKKHKLIVMDEAVDLRGTYYPRETSNLRNKLGIPENNKVVVTVAPFSNPRKGTQYYLEAAKLLSERKDITFVHVGFDGDRKICPSNYIPISYVSNQDELAEYYSLADLFVCTSLAETIPASCLEALSCGSPILGFKISGMPTCADEKRGTFVEACNSKQLADVISEISKKSENDISMCREYAKSRFDAKEYRMKLVDLIKGE